MFYEVYIAYERYESICNKKIIKLIHKQKFFIFFLSK